MYNTLSAYITTSNNNLNNYQSYINYFATSLSGELYYDYVHSDVTSLQTNMYKYVNSVSGNLYHNYVKNCDFTNYPLLTTFNDQEAYNCKFMDKLSGKVNNIQNANHNYLYFVILIYLKKKIQIIICTERV